MSTTRSTTNNAVNEKQQQLKYIASVVRALVTSRKPPCTLREILREYPEVESKQLPFRALGYGSAEELLRETGEFLFRRIGTETCISTKANNKTAHIASMVKEQKSSKSTRVSQLKQVRRPWQTDQSWNKSSFSTLPQNRARTAWNGDRNNNNQQLNNRNNNNYSDNYKPQQQQQLQRQKSCGDELPKPKDLREMLQAKIPQQQVGGNSNNNNNNTVSKVRTVTQQQQQQQQQKMSNGNPKADLRDRLNIKLQQQQSVMPRPILGQNNSYAIAATGNGKHNSNNTNNNGINNAAAAGKQQSNKQPQQQSQSQQQQQQNQLPPTAAATAAAATPAITMAQQQLLQQNSAAIAKGSSLILAQREAQRAELLAKQAQQQQQMQQKLQQQQQQLRRPLGNFPRINVQAAAVDGGGVLNSAAASSVQDRLKIRIQNNYYTNGGDAAVATTPNSAGNTPSETDGTPNSSPAISSAGSEQMQNPFGSFQAQQAQQLQQQQFQLQLLQQQTQPQAAQFHKQRFVKSPPPTSEAQPVIPPKIFQFNPNLDPITSLSQYCLVRRCSQPEYSVLKSKYSRLYQCRVHVNGSIFSTYPNEYPNEHIAKISCAQKAIEQIKMDEQRRPLPPCAFTDKELTEKLHKELLNHPHGIFAKKIPEWFGSTFQQNLPDHWWTLVQTSSKFTTEEAASNSVIVFANSNAVGDADGSNGSTVIQMDGIALPWKQKYWDIYVTHCVSTVEVWARLFGTEYNSRLDDLMNDIDVYMLTEKARPVSIVCKNIYLVCISECWHRVRVEEMDKINGMALCFFIDFGDADWVLVNTLYICEPKFLSLPAQAVPFSLFGLEDFAGNPNARRQLEALLQSKSVVGEVLTKEVDFYASDASGPCCDRIQVALYDTSTDQDINLNPVILNKICDDTRPPEIKRTGVTNVLVTHITQDGQLYLQIRNNEYVQKLLQTLIASKFKRDQHKVTAADLQRSNLFLICDETSQANDSSSTNGTAQQQQANWYRGALADRKQFSVNDVELDVFCVDHGETRRIHISQMYRLESLSTALSKVPPQAIKVRLDNIPDITKSIVGRMRALLPGNCEAMVKMTTPGVVPAVTIYRRLETDTLCTINDVIRIEHELESASVTLNADGTTAATSDNTKSGSVGEGGLASPTTTNNSFVEMTRGLTITSVPNSPRKSGELLKLKEYEDMPVLGEFFEVRVTMSANPSNFMIQPYKDYTRLRDMMKELQDYCENNDEFIPADMVVKGQAYAAKHPDGFYHRVIVVDKFHGDMIHVSYCDFGDVVIFSSDELKTLPAKFRQLPQMAIHAKLQGIAPRDVDWSLGDCIRFRELTVGQKFVSTIKRISYETNERILELDLIDVQTDEDVFISQVLLTENRAVELKS